MSGAPEAQTARPNPYVGPRAFTRGETIYGRDRELQRLLHLLIAERIVALYSPSGAGKTSLIQAGLLPRLEQEDFVVLPVVRVSLEPPPADADGQTSTRRPNRYIQSVILSLEEGQSPSERLPLHELAELDLPTYLERRCREVQDRATEWVLVFDQFEEILTIDPTDEAARTEFFEQVGAALRDRRLWALFALREDYLAGLDPYVRPIPTRLHTTFRLDLLGPEAARMAIQQPAREVGVEFQDAAAERLIDDLRHVAVQQLDGSMLDQLGAYVEPVQLQVVCRRLWDHLPEDTTRIVETDIEAVGDVDQALAAFYADQVAGVASQTGVSERAIREWVDHHLITDQGIRGQVLQALDSSEGLSNTAILALVDTYLVRAERRRGFTWFELAHDRLIGPVRIDNANWFERNLSDLQRTASLWERQDRPPELLLRGKAFKDAVAWAEAHDNELTSIERDFMAAARSVDEAAARDRRRVQWIQRLGVGAALLALVSTTASIVAIRQTVHANELTDYADQQTALAVQNADDAKQSADDAKQQRDIATLRGLVSKAGALFHSRPDQALLVSLEAMKQSDNAETRGTLLDALNSEPQLDGVLPGHTNRVRGLAFTGGQPASLVSISTDNTLRTWALPDQSAERAGQQTGSMSITIASARMAVTSPDGQYAATLTQTGSDREIHLWSVQQQAEVAHWPTDQRVDALAFSRDSMLLGAVGPDPDENTTAQIKLWNVPDGTLEDPDQPLTVPWPRQTCEPPTQSCPALPTNPSWTSLAFGDDGKGRLLAFGTSNGEVVWLKLYDRTQPPKWSARKPVTITVTSLAFSPDGQYLIEGTSGHDVYRWNANGASTQTPFTLKGHKLAVRSIAFDPVPTQDNPPVSMFATASADGTIILWDATKGQPYAAPLEGHASEVDAIAFSPDGTQLASAGLDGPIRVWNVPPDETALGVDAAPLGMRLPNPTKGLGMQALAFDSNGQYLAGLYGNSSVVVWDTSVNPVPEPRPEATINPNDPNEPKNAEVTHLSDLAFTPDGTQLVTAGCIYQASKCQQGVVNFWDSTTHQPARATLTTDSANLASLALDPNSDLLVAGDSTGRLHIWHLTDPSPQDAVVPPQGKQSIQALRFSPDGTLLVSSASDGLFLWHVGDMTSPPTPLLAGTAVVGSPKALAFSPTGALLASVSSDSTEITVWNVADGQAGKRGGALTGHLGAVNELAFIDDRTLASVSQDATLRLWDVSGTTGVSIGQPLTGYPFNVSAVAYNATLGRLATASPTNLSGAPSVNNNLILWQMQNGSWATMACRIAGHNLSSATWTRLMGDLPYDDSLCPGLPVVPEKDDRQ